MSLARISNGFVTQFQRPSVKRPQTEKMRSTKDCEAGALISSYAKAASRGTHTPAFPKTAMDLTETGCCATGSGTCSFQTIGLAVSVVGVQSTSTSYS